MFEHEGMDRTKSAYGIKYKGRQLPKSGMMEYTFHFSKKLMDEQGWASGQKLTYGYDKEIGQFGFREYVEGQDLQGWTLQNINVESANCRFTRKSREDRGYPVTEGTFGVELTVTSEKVEALGSQWVMAQLPEDAFSGTAEESLPSTEEKSEYGQ